MEFPATKTIDVVGVGNALMDILVEVPDSFLVEHALEKGHTYFVDEAESLKYQKLVSDKPVRTMPGGATANTIRCVSHLGGRGLFYGAVGADLYGEMYKDALLSQGVDARLAVRDTITGTAITYITQDGERTFTDHLGAAPQLQIADIDEAIIAAAKIVHLEGYQLEGETLPVLQRVCELAKQHQTLLSLDLNDAGLVTRNLDLFQHIVAEYVDILFMNETEAEAFTAVDARSGLEKAHQSVSTVVLKLGSQGSAVGVHGAYTTIAPFQSNVIDTTGAGDIYAGSFLFGLTQGWDATRAATLGSELAAEIISVVGVDVAALKTRAW